MYTFLRFPGGKQKAVTFSYDDGFKSDQKLIEIFNKYKLKATFNLNSNKITANEDGEHLTVDEVKKYILGGGHEVALHGKNHLANGKLRPIDGIREVLDCRLELEEKFGTIINGMAYANSGITVLENGTEYQTIRNYLQNLGVAYARTLGGDNNEFQLPADWYAWMPTAHHDNEHIFEYINDFAQIANDNTTYPHYRTPKLFYCWGHSFEFDQNDNWDRIEEICNRLTAVNDVWYAANIEIYNYVAAYDSLVFSASGDMVYNPTGQSVWFERIGDKIYCVNPNQTLKI